MSFKFTKNIKVGVQCSEGELVFEFRRPTKEELNKFTAEKLDLKQDNMEKRLNAVDEMRVQFFDHAIESVYMLTRDGKREEVVKEGEDDKPMLIKDFPDDVKSRAVLNAFEMNQLYVKNL